MTGTVTTSKGRTSGLALLALLAAVGLCAAIPSGAAAAPPATESGAAADRPAASYPASTADSPSLTDEQLAPEGDTGSELWVGFGLLGLGVLGLAAAVAVRVAVPLPYRVGPEPSGAAAAESE